MLTKKKITPTDYLSLVEIDEFIKNNLNGVKTFRYFLKRPYTVIKNHIYTCLYYIGSNCVGYGHLDYENGKIWLGIMVSDNEVGKQIGTQIMDDLIQQTTDIIYLSVDINNERGLKLYNKKGFEVIKKTEDHYVMKLDKLNK
jgi:GNAT superfamily N-acetyltransferase